MDKKITEGGYVPRPGQTAPNTIILRQTQRFNIDITDFMRAVHNYELIDYPRRYRLFDLYQDILIDTHLQSVIGKRHDAIQDSEIVFMRDGKIDDAIGEQISAPWFSSMIDDILDAKFHGFSLMQFYKENGWIKYYLVPRKNVDPVNHSIIRQQTDLQGIPWDNFSNLVFVGKERDLGDLACCVPWVIYKRNDMADWAQFCEIFGMPIREYTYDETDENSRERALADADAQGSLSTFIHGKDTTMNLVDTQTKSTASDLYQRLSDTCNAEISKMILGNTLTTDSGSGGTQALGKVHSKEESKKTKSDRKFILEYLNYHLTDTFQALGLNTKGGKFIFRDPKDIDLTAKMNIIVQARSINVPISDDYIYEEFGIDKPDNYDELKRKLEEDAAAARRDKLAAASQQKKGDDTGDEGGDGDEKHNQKPIDNQTKGNQNPPSDKSEKNFFARLRDFFSDAPHRGGALEW
jgi:phage gp29-like protein